ncbi:MAG: hypothetical protein ACK4P3_04150 [Fimbriimonadaceae bacterium]
MSKGLLITLIAVGGVLLMCGGMAVTMMIMWRPMMRSIEPQIACSVHMSGLQSALSRYANKHGRAPDAESWQQELAPFVLGREEVDIPFFDVPAIDFEAPLRCNLENPETGIAFNRSIAGKSWSDIPDTAVTFFEWPEVELNLSVPFKELPEAESPKIVGTPRGWVTVTKGRFSTNVPTKGGGSEL